MKLTREFKDQVLAGKAPALTDEPDLEPGQRIDIERDQVSITVLRFTKGARWEYSIRDDRPLWMGKGGGYTRMPNRAIPTRDPEGRYEDEVLDKHAHKKYEMEARLRQAERRNPEERAKKDSARLGRAVRELAIKAARGGVDPVVVIAELQRRIKELNAEVDEKLEKAA